MVCVLCGYPRTYIKLQSKTRLEHTFPQLIQKYGGIEIVKGALGAICKKCHQLLIGLHKKATRFYNLCQEARKRIYDTDEPVPYPCNVAIAPPPTTPSCKEQVSFILPLLPETETEMPPVKKARLEYNDHNYYSASAVSNPSLASNLSLAQYSPCTTVVHKVISSAPMSTTATHTPWINRTLGSECAIRMSSHAVVTNVDKDKQSPLVAKVLVSKPNPGNSAARGVPLVAKVVGIAKLDATEEEIESAKRVKTSSIGPTTSTSSTPRYGVGELMPHANYHNTMMHHSKPSTSKSNLNENSQVLSSKPKSTILAPQTTTVYVSPNPKAAQNTTRVLGQSNNIYVPSKPNSNIHKHSEMLEPCSTPVGGKVLISKPLYATSHVAIKPCPNPILPTDTGPDITIAPLIARAKSLADRYYAPPQITVKEYQQIISTLQAGDADLLADVLLGSSTLRQSITRKLVKEAERNLDRLSPRRTMSMLRSRDKGLAAAIKDFSWESVVNENLQIFPTLIDMMLGISLGKDGMKDAEKVEKVTPRIGFIMAILLQNRHLGLGLVQRMNTIILYHSKKKAKFAMLQKLGICLSLKARAKLAEELPARTVDELKW